MAAIWWTILIIAGGILLYMLLRHWLNKGVFMRILTNLALSAAVVYMIKLFGILDAVELVVNIPNVLIAGILGLPGVAMLYAVHLIVLK